MQRKLFLTISSMAVVLLAGMLSYLPVSAYVIGRWEGTSVSYYYQTYPDLFSYGANSWNGLDAGFHYAATNYQVFCYAVNEPNAKWDGVSSIKWGNVFFSSVSISINAGYSRTWNDSNAVNSVVSHEFGHALGLGDTDGTRVVMNGVTWGPNSRYETYRITSPQAGDRAEVNAIY